MKGVCEQIVDGDHTIQLLYDHFDGDGGSEHQLKNICSGGSSTSFVPGVDFTVSSIVYNSSGKTYAGKSIVRVGHTLQCLKSIRNEENLMKVCFRFDTDSSVESLLSGPISHNV